jgi:cell division protein FtsA
MMGKRGGILVVDVGTTKICALIGEEREGKVWVTGIGVVPSRGLKRGAVINIEEATGSIKEAIKQAQSQADVKIESIYTSIAGSHIKTTPSMGVVALREVQVTSEDVENVIKAAESIKLPSDRQILHVIPQEFVIDNQRGILHPVGMAGMRLEVQVQLITCNRSSLQNLLKCFENLGLEVDRVVFQGFASAEAVLTSEEKELGVVLVDFGGGTTDIVVYWDNVLRHVASIPVGGELLTNDLAVGLRTSRKAAEKIKIEKGVCLKELIKDEEEIEVPGIGNRPSKKISKRLLAEILEMRVRELIELIENELDKLEVKSRVSSGLVLTGGSSLLPGLVSLTDQILDLPTRIGFPPKLGGLTEEIYNPQYATAVGILLYAFSQKGGISEKKEKKPGFFEKIKSFFGFK